jgi:hypothetical protein
MLTIKTIAQPEKKYNTVLKKIKLIVIKGYRYPKFHVCPVKAQEKCRKTNTGRSLFYTL